MMIFLLVAFHVHIHTCLRVFREDPTPARNSKQVSCSSGHQQILDFFQCDGLRDCQDGSDESAAACAASDFEQFLEDKVRMIKPEGYQPPDRVRYKKFWDRYDPIMACIPVPGESLALVEVWQLQAPAYIDSCTDPIAKAILRLIMISFGVLHMGVGLVFRAKDGRELSRIALQFWQAVTVFQDNPNMLPENNTLTYDAAGRLLVTGRSVLTYLRMRGHWEHGYWSENAFFGTIDAHDFGKKLPWLDNYIVSHPQFIPLGIQDTQGHTVILKVDCNLFVRAFIREFTGYDNLIHPGVLTWVYHFEAEILERNAESRRVVKMTGGDSTKLSTNNSPYFLQCPTFLNFQSSLPWVSMVYDSHCETERGKFMIVPAAYDADGHPVDLDEFVSHVHIFRTTGRMFAKEKSRGWREAVKYLNTISVGAFVMFLVLLTFCLLKNYCFQQDAQTRLKQASSI